MFYTYAEDLAPGMVGPFATRAAAEAHIEFCRERGDADPGRVLTEEEAEAQSQDGVLLMTPEKDRSFLLPL